MKKNIVDYAVLTLFILGVGLAICAVLDHQMLTMALPYLHQGQILLAMGAAALIGLLCMRLVHKASLRMQEKSKKAWYFILICLIIAAGTALRFWAIRDLMLTPYSDFQTYFRLATELVDDTLLTPAAALDSQLVAMQPHMLGYPMLVLAPLFRLTGVNVNSALMINLVISMLCVFVLSDVGRRLYGRLGGVICAVLLSIWPSWIIYSSMVTAEPFFALLLLLALDMMVCILDHKPGSLYRRAPWYCVAWLPVIGILVSYAGAVRPLAAVLLTSFSLALLRSSKETPTGDEYSGAHGFLTHRWLCLVLVLVPFWLTSNLLNGTITNLIGEKPVSGITAIGYDLMVGVNTESIGEWNQPDALFRESAYQETGSAEEAMHVCLQEAVRRIQATPENVLDLMLNKFRRLWQTDDFGIDWNIQCIQWDGSSPEKIQQLEQFRPYGRILYACVLMFAFIGAIQIWQRIRRVPPGVFICMLFFLGMAVSYMLLETQVRYHYSVIPFLIMLAVSTLHGWRERVKEEPLMILYERPGREDIMEDHTNFDMASAVHGGNIKLSVSKTYDREVDGKPAMLGNVPVSDVHVVESSARTTPSDRPNE